MPPVSDWNLNYQSTSEAQRLNTIAAVKLTDSTKNGGGALIDFGCYGAAIVVCRNWL